MSLRSALPVKFRRTNSKRIKSFNLSRFRVNSILAPALPVDPCGRDAMKIDSAKVHTRLGLILVSAVLAWIAGGTARAASNPVVIYTDVTSGPTSGGENNLGGYVSIFGLHFGTTISNVHVYFGNNEVAAYRYLGASNGRSDIQQLTVQPGALNGAAGSLPIKVTVSGLDSNTDKTFMVNPGRVL